MALSQNKPEQQGPEFKIYFKMETNKSNKGSNKIK